MYGISSYYARADGGENLRASGGASWKQPSTAQSLRSSTQTLKGKQPVQDDGYQIQRVAPPKKETKAKEDAPLIKETKARDPESSIKNNAATA